MNKHIHTGDDVRTSSNSVCSIRNVNDFNGPKWQEMHNAYLLYYNKTIVDVCFSNCIIFNKVKKLYQIFFQPDI